MNRIDKKFKELRRCGEKAFIPFLTVGYPDIKTTERLVLAFEKQGADIVELGVPFSDPVADGSVIQMSSFEALKRGVTLKKVLRLTAALRRKTQMPLAAMTYYNPVLQFGPERFAKEAVRAGLDAVIIPDLPPEEEPGFMKAAARSGLRVILFVAPTTTPERLRFIVQRSRGFIYFVSLTGVTGARKELPLDLKSQIRRIKKMTRIPVCAGFGISTPQQARLAASYGDGVIVGSALIKKISENKQRADLVRRVSRFAGRIASHV
jgi:tryptophan synthase alpha chain